MSLEIRLNDRISKVEMVSRDKQKIIIRVDGKTYEIDVVKVEEGFFSVLLGGKSYTVHLLKGENAKRFRADTDSRSYDIEVIDAESRYMSSRKGEEPDDAGKHISSPMPGKVVKIPVKIGEKVEVGQTMIIVSAMKMESEYKTAREGVVSEILVEEGDTIEGHQPLITIE